MPTVLDFEIYPRGPVNLFIRVAMYWLLLVCFLASDCNDIILDTRGSSLSLNVCTECIKSCSIVGAREMDP